MTSVFMIFLAPTHVTEARILTDTLKVVGLAWGSVGLSSRIESGWGFACFRNCLHDTTDRAVVAGNMLAADLSGRGGSGARSFWKACAQGEFWLPRADRGQCRLNATNTDSHQCADLQQLCRIVPQV
jgi:hypothetical protein